MHFIHLHYMQGNVEHRDHIKQQETWEPKMGVYKPSSGNLTPLPVGDKLTISRGILTDEHIYKYCTNYEQLLLIQTRQIIDSCLLVKSNSKCF